VPLPFPPFLPEDGSRASFRNVVFLKGKTLDDGLSPKARFFEKYLWCRLGGVVVSVLATQSLRVRTRPRRWIFKGDTNPQHTFLSDGK
jgi:hypothetical protein